MGVWGWEKARFEDMFCFYKTLIGQLHNKFLSSKILIRFSPSLVLQSTIMAVYISYVHKKNQTNSAGYNNNSNHLASKLSKY